MAVPGTDLLCRVDLFAVLAAPEQAQLATLFRRRRYRSGAVLFLRGDPGASLYLVEEGWVRLVLASDAGKEFTLDLIGPGACFGELALLDGEPRSADAIAQEDCAVLLLPKADFERFLAAHPRAARALLAVLSRRLRRDALLLHEAVFEGIADRLGRALLRIAEQQADAAAPVARWELRVTQEELAGALGVTRESVNKWLGYYERRSTPRRRRGQITLLRPEALRATE
jgi:CRP-like cAMP-binding protein